MKEIEIYFKLKIMVTGSRKKDCVNFLKMPIWKFNEKLKHDTFSENEIERLLYFFGDKEINIDVKTPYEKLMIYVIKNSLSWRELACRCGVAPTYLHGHRLKYFVHMPDDLARAIEKECGIDKNDWRVLKKTPYNIGG